MERIRYRRRAALKTLLWLIALPIVRAMKAVEELEEVIEREEVKKRLSVLERKVTTNTAELKKLKRKLAELERRVEKLERNCANTQDSTRSGTSKRGYDKIL